MFPLDMLNGESVWASETCVSFELVSSHERVESNQLLICRFLKAGRRWSKIRTISRAVQTDENGRDSKIGILVSWSKIVAYEPIEINYF